MANDDFANAFTTRAKLKVNEGRNDREMKQERGGEKY